MHNNPHRPQATSQLIRQRCKRHIVSLLGHHEELLDFILVDVLLRGWEGHIHSYVS